METAKIITLIKTINKFPLDAILAKEFILSGIDTEEKLVNILVNENEIPRHTKVSIQNFYRDINNGLYNIDKIPTIFYEVEKRKTV